MKNNKLLLGFIGIYCLYCFLLAFIAPIFIRPLIPEQAKNFIHGDVELKSLSINPFSNSVTLHGLKLNNSKGLPLASFDELSVNIDLLPFIFLNADIDSLDIDNLKLFTGDNAQPWLTLAELSIDDTSVAIKQQTVDIEEISLEKLVLLVTLYADNSTNIHLFLTEIDQLLIQESETPVEESSAEQAPWLVRIDEIELHKGSVTLLDKLNSSEQYPDGISTTISPITINLASIHSDLSQAISFKLKAELLKGKVELKGSIHPDTLASKLTYELKALQLSELNPYVQHFSLASISSGSLSTQGAIETFQQISEVNASETESISTTATDTDIKPETEPALDMKLSNATVISDLIVKHQNFDTPLVNCAAIETTGLDFSLLASSLLLDKVSLKTCLINPYLDKKGAGNFDLMKAETAQTAQASPTQTKKEDGKQSNQDLKITINLVELIDSAVNVEDFSQGEGVNLLIGDIQANITHIAAGKSDLSHYQLSALLNKHAPLSIQGQGNFMNEKLSTQGKVTIKNLGLKEFSPYALNISSRPIDKGVFALNIDIDAQENKLNSLASLDLLGLDLGKKQTVEGASKLPIGLALGILKDSKGNIHFDIPVKGDLDDPSFSVSKQIIKTLTGIITKAATAPLSMVGGLVSGGSNTNSLQILFSTGQVLPNAQQEKDIQKLSSVLKKRPELSIRLSTRLSAAEALTLNNDEQKIELLTQRQNAVSNALLNSGVNILQIEASTINSTETADASELKLDFFAR